jgi:hypothetical protein
VNGREEKSTSRRRKRERDIEGKDEKDQDKNTTRGEPTRRKSDREK